MKFIGNLFLIPFKLILLLMILPMLVLNLFVSIFTGIANGILGLISGIFGIIFLYQLLTQTQDFYSITGALLLFMFFGTLSLILAFFPATISMLSSKLGKGIAFWF